MHLCLSHSPCLQQLLQSWREEPRSPLSFRSCLARPLEPRRPKKQVVFADAKGLALVSVHRFDNAADRDSEEGSGSVPRLPGPAPALPAEPTTYALGFPPPGQDEPGFRGRLQAQSVCLERCAVEGAFLRGSVRARSLGVPGAARLRITFDAWGSFQEVPCVHQPGPRGGETHSYAFQVELPLGPPGPADTIQFCFSLECAQQLLWDNNEGQNYCLVPGSQSCWSE